MKSQGLNSHSLAISKVELSSAGQLPSKQCQNLAKASYGMDEFLLVQCSMQICEIGLLRMILTVMDFYITILTIHFILLLGDA